MDEIMLRIDNVSKMYKLGQIGGTTLRDELQRKMAKLKGQEDPTRKIGAKNYNQGETFMALNGVSFEVKKGERIGIIGHNGAGKSTLLKLISRVTAPSGGKIQMNGRVASMLEVGTGFHPELTGRENVYMNGAILGMTKKEIDAKMEEIIDFSEVRQFIDTPVKRYSSGMYVKLAFSVAAHLDSEILIMDEVLAVGDMAFQKKCLDKMNDVSKTKGRTILYVSHNMNTIRQLCNRVVVLDHGTVVFDGDVEEGIGIYLGINKNSSSNIIDVSEFMHDLSGYDKNVSIEKITFDNKKSSINQGESINVKINIMNHCEKDRDIFLRVMLNSQSGEIVTMSPSEKAFKILSNESVTKYYRVNLSSIAPGNYSMSFVLYEIGAYGADANVDVLRKVYNFTIQATTGFNHDVPWNTKWWGYTAIGYLKELD